MYIGRGLRCLLICGVFGALLLGVILYLTLEGRGGGEGGSGGGGGDTTESWVYPPERKARGAIASNGGPCAAIGMEVLKKGGMAVDGLIATMLCDGVTCMQNMGLGGGFVGTLYIKKLGKVVTINARESAPAAATQDMFVANKSLSLHGGLAVAVPGELRGYHEMYTKYGGGVEWSELFTGTIRLCEEGVPVNRHLHRNIASNRDLIMSMPTLRKILLNENGTLPVFGDKIKLPKLAETLRIIAKEGPDAIYNGSLTAGFVKDIHDNGGIITPEDLASYSPRWEEPVTTKLSTGDTVHSVPLPGSGPILAYIMRVLDGQLTQPLDSLNTTFKISEAFKFAYGIRSRLGDSHFVNTTQVLGLLNDESYINSIKKKLNSPMTSNDPNYYGSHFVDDHGTANIVVVGPNGDALSVTSTINTIFGSCVVSESTGIILNNEMDDFSTPGLVNYFGVPPSPENFIAPGKRPMSSMVPTIVLGKDGMPRLISGAAGGTKITTATALSVIRNIWFEKSAVDSVREARYHHQLMPMTWSYEKSITSDLIEGMKQLGHNTTASVSSDSCVTAISISGDVLGPSSDMRRPGNTSFLLS